MSWKRGSSTHHIHFNLKYITKCHISVGDFNKSVFNCNLNIKTISGKVK